MSTASDAVFRRGIIEPTAIDPYRAQEIEGVGVVNLLFTGLVGIADGHNLTPAVARSWDCTPDGLSWTFRLRDDARFSTGESVDAESFVRGINRALDPVAASESAYHASGIDGYAKMKSGESVELSGLRAKDRLTLVFELSQPDFGFASKTLQPLFSPVPAGAGAAENPEFNDQPIGNGPFMLTEPWQHDHSITLRANPYWSGPCPDIKVVHLDILPSAGAYDEEYARFEAGYYDYARLSANRVRSARAKYGSTGKFLMRDLPGLHYLIPFCHRPPMDSPIARRAVSLAIDRDQIAQDLLDSRYQRATSLLSPWFKDAFRPELGQGYVEFDPVAARGYAELAGLTAGTSIDLAYNVGGGHDEWVRAVGAQLEANLGLNVRLLGLSARDLVAHRTSPAASGLCRAGWAYDYPTPDNLLFSLLHSSCTSPDVDGVAHGDNEGRFHNLEFDAAVERARSRHNDEERSGAWSEAERIALADLALIPLWYRTEYRMVAADRFAGIDLDFFGNPTLAAMRPVDPHSRRS